MKDKLPDIAEGVAAQLVVVVGVSLDHDVQQAALTPFVNVPIVAELLGKFGEVFQNDADGVDDRRCQLNVDRQNLRRNRIDKLVKFLRRQLQNHAAQEFRHVLRYLGVADFQAVEQFDGQLIALRVRHVGGDAQQAFPCRLADKDGLADFQKVRQMHAQVHDVALVARIVHIPHHQLYIGDLDAPVGPHLQVDEEQAAFMLGKGLFISGQIHHRQEVAVILFLRISVIKAALRVQGGDAQVLGGRLQGRFYKGADCRHKFLRNVAALHVVQDLQEHDIPLFRIIAALEILGHHADVIAAVLRLAEMQYGFDKAAQAIADPQLVLLRKPHFRIDNHIQILIKQGQARDDLMGKGHALRQLLCVFFVEISDNAPHEGRRLEADVPFFMRQQLVQEFQRHDLLMLCHVRRILFEDADIGTDVFPQLLAAGRFDEVAEIAVVAEDTHEADVVSNGRVLQLFDDFSLRQEHHFPRLWNVGLDVIPRKVGRQLDDALFPHERLEIGQLGVYLLVPVALRLVYVVQFS